MTTVRPSEVPPSEVPPSEEPPSEEPPSEEPPSEEPPSEEPPSEEPPSEEPRSEVRPSEVMVALRFFRAAREEPSLQARLRSLDPSLGLAAVADVAVTAGYSVSIESLRAAHAHDWALRRARFLLDGDQESEGDGALSASRP